MVGHASTNHNSPRGQVVYKSYVTRIFHFSVGRREIVGLKTRYLSPPFWGVFFPQIGEKELLR